jgi:hypothetical protein
MSDKKQILGEIAKHHEALAALYRQLAGDDQPRAVETKEAANFQSPTIRQEQGHASNGGEFIDLDVEEISFEVHPKSGEIIGKAKGGPYKKYGVPVYQEMLATFGYDLETLRPGQHETFKERVRVLMKEGKPYKVVGLSQ